MKRAKIDKLGRIVIPIGYRKALRITHESEMTIQLRGNEIIITTSESICKICEQPLDHSHELSICTACISKIKSTIF